jgi:predicted nucleic acid-binding protein
MLFEYEAVVMRPEQLQATGMTVAEVGVFFDGLAALLLPVLPYFLWRPLWRDPDDEMMLDAAVNGQADVIVTFNIHDFLSA